jgi:hypothetical protein
MVAEIEADLAESAPVDNAEHTGIDPNLIEF